MQRLGFIFEKEVREINIETCNLIRYLDKQNLTQSIAFVRPCSKAFVKEFYANLNKFMTYPNCARFEKIYICGHILEFSPRIINRYVGCLTFIDGIVIDEIHDLVVIYVAITRKEEHTWSSYR